MLRAGAIGPPFRRRRRSILSTIPPAPAAPAVPNTPSPAAGTTALFTLLTWLSDRATKFDIYLQTTLWYVASVFLNIPTGYWRLNEAPGATSVSDISNNGYAGAVTGGVAFGQPGALGDGDTAALFDGAHGTGITLTSQPPIPAHFTVEAWINRQGSATDLFQYIWGSGGAVGFPIEFALQANTLAFFVNFTTLTPGWINTPFTPSLGVWYHVAMTWDGTSLIVYVNGAAVYTNSASWPGLTLLNVGSTSGVRSIGWQGPGNNQCFNGYLDDVTFYSTALSAAQLARDAAARAVAATPVVIHRQAASYVPTLLPGSSYYWQVIAINDGGQSYGPVWSFLVPAQQDVFVTLAGALTARVRNGSISIKDTLGSPMTASAIFDTAAPVSGESVQIGLGGLDPPKLLFGGEIQTDEQKFFGTETAPFWPVTLTDKNAVANKRRPFGTWTDVSATIIGRSIAADFAPTLTVNGIQDDLPLVTITLDGQQDFSGCLQAIATAFNGYQRVTPAGDIRLFEIETADAPDPVNETNRPLNDKSPITFGRDTSQVRTRVYGKGHTEQVPCDVAAGETIIPIADAVMFNPMGGQAIAGTISGGAQSQILTYDGVQISAAGSLVGPGIGPSAAPAVAIVPGAGLNVGTYEYGYTDVTAAGESLLSPLATIVTKAQPPTPIAPVYPGHSGTNATVNIGLAGDTLEWVVSYSDAPTANDLTQEGAVSASSGPITLVASGFGGVFVPFVTIPYSSSPDVQWLHAWVSRNGGTYVRVPVFVDSANVAIPGSAFGAIPNILGSGTVTFQDGSVRLADVVPATGPLTRVAISAVAIGPAPVTNRKIYRTVVNGSQLKLLTTLADNITLVFADSTPDAALGANAPVSDASGLTQQSGQVNAGSASIPVANGTQFQANGGWVMLGSQFVRYTGVLANMLTGIPVSGVGSIITTVLYGSQALPAPALTGVNSNNGLRLAMASGSSIAIWVQRDDLEAQAALGQIELDDQGNPTDGIHEFTIVDERRGEASLIELCDADLASFNRPIISTAYDIRDPKSGSGKLVPIDTTVIDPVNGVRGDFLIQEVTITFDGPALMPRYSVKAASTRFSLRDLLQKVLIES